MHVCKDISILDLRKFAKKSIFGILESLQRYLFRGISRLKKTFLWITCFGNLLQSSRMLCSRGMFQQWSLAVFLLCSPVPLYGRPIDALTNRMRRSVSHAQLMHDKGRSLHEFKRRQWIQQLLDQVHTSDSERAPPPQSRSNANGGNANGGHSTFSGSSLSSPKPSGGTKNLPLSFRLGGEGGNLPQETNKSLAYKHQPLKVVTKRKKKVKGERGRRKESEKRRRRARSVVTSLTTQREESQTTQDTG